MKKSLMCLTVVASVVTSSNILAHGDKPKHGGIVQASSDLSFEMVNKDHATIIYVEDHGKKLPTTGATGKLTILNGMQKSELPLEPAGENTLAAKGDTKLDKGAKAIASITFADKKTVNVRFSVK
ncbi:TPA: hypothetical protein JBD06_06835 [Legionella pneumophila subsp. pneumophila]|nr:hypothetical protein [Legionella pneumophila subsp. pneumophila]